MTDETVTSVDSPQVATGSAEHIGRQQRFRDNRAKIMAANAGDFHALLPGWDLIPPDQQAGRLEEAIKAITREQFKLMHDMQTASTGPRKKTAAKAAPAPSAKAKVSGIVDDLL